ncbi:MAG: hypothetical protein H5T98_01085 [Syntrophomonadaceae bacterium]|nr:hypothetical protein [Syntrophomonadaceae bacterium]
MKALILVLLSLFSLPVMATPVWYMPTTQVVDGKLLYIVLTDTHWKGCPSSMMNGRLVVRHALEKGYNRYPICWRDDGGDGVTVYFPHTGQWFYNQSVGLVDTPEAHAAYQRMMDKDRAEARRKGEALNRAMENEFTNRGQ